MKILIIEDEQALLELMLKYFSREGYLCEFAGSLKEGFRKVTNYSYDCVIVDLNLPGGDGSKLIEMLRGDEEHNQTGVLVVSARHAVQERVKMLELGADDYLVKPFNLSELNARIKAVARRKTGQFSKSIEYGNLVLELDKRTVRFGESQIDLTKKEFDILLFLARNKNRVVTKNSIAEHLWGDHMDETFSYDFLYAHIKNLRRKLSEANCGDYLQTVYGIGYKFEAV